MKDYIRGKTVIVTGGTSGFGLETAAMLLERGAKVAITGRDSKRLGEANARLAKIGGENLLAVKADATSTADWKRLISQTSGKFGRIDVLVNNAGAGVKIAPTEGMDDEAIQKILDINIAGVIKGCREVLPVMRKQARGHIINVSSACATHSWPNWGVYTAAKAGLVAYTRCLHLEMVEWGGKATSFIPGAARTNFCAAAELDDSWQAGLPSGEDFARTLVHCIDVPENSFIEEVSIWGVKQVVNPF